MRDYTAYEEVQVTDCYHSVLNLTQEGWKLLDIKGTGSVESGYQEQYKDPNSSNCPNCSSHHDCYGSPNPNTINGSVVLTKALFILGKAKDEVVAGLRTDLSEREDFVKKQTEQIEKLNKSIEELGRKIDAKDEHEKYLGDRIERLEKDVEHKRKLESHLDKAKRLVGDRDWEKKVVGED